MAKYDSQSAPEKPKSHPNLPIVEEKKVIKSKESHNPPTDDDFAGGIFKKIEGDFSGESFALAIHEQDCYGRTHSLKNTLHFWQGSALEFKTQFDKA